MMKGAAVIFFLVVVALAAARPGQAISCDQVQGSMASCVSYLTGSGSEPSGECCSGVQSVSGSMQSTQDRQTVCNCLKSAAGSFNVNPSAASSLPGKCGVSIGGYSISPNMDCSQIS